MGNSNLVSICRVSGPFGQNEPRQPPKEPPIMVVHRSPPETSIDRGKMVAQEGEINWYPSRSLNSPEKA
ncbi:hypothetical protein JCGZ_20069 [Jatropha curcas]|uniref:Uncharacterized protein n=1 Tax=Jatropha curcas TaxID=180498 RepID=A0A067LJD1_JATCU|nr:hypothetical protein JCGZ_20069 [Jatropha curcas]